VLAGGGAGVSAPEIPDEAEIAFDLAWTCFPFAELRFLMGPDAASPTGFDGNGYAIRILGWWAVCRCGNTPLAKEPLPPVLNGRRQVCLKIRISRAKRRIALLADDSLVSDWALPGEWRGTGTGLAIVSAVADLRVRGVRVSKANGPWTFPPSPLEKRRNVDRVLQVNGDRVSGILTGVTDGAVRIASTVLGDVGIPLTGTLALALRQPDQKDDAEAKDADQAKDDAEAKEGPGLDDDAIMAAGDSVARFTDGSVLRVKVNGMADGVISAKHHLLGALSIPVEALRSLELSVPVGAGAGLGGRAQGDFR
jgi:hypothetical protein